MNTTFTRTPRGLAIKWVFHEEPIIWVEGPTDIPFFSPIVADMHCRLETINGCANAECLIEGIRQYNFPYSVILDGDYSILKSRRSPHRRVIILRRYSHENYLWERDPFHLTCIRHAQHGAFSQECLEEFDRITQHIEDTLREALVLDIAARSMDSPPPVLPKRIERLLTGNDQPELDELKLKKLTSESRKTVCPSSTSLCDSKIADFLQNNRLVDLVNGHLVFGVLRILFTKVTTTLRGKKCVIPDDALRSMLSEMVWQTPPTPEHKRLKKVIRRSVRETISLRAQAASTLP